MKILVAEDDDFLINAYKVKLEKNNFEVIIAKDGEEALEQLRSNTPDVLVLDLIMPKKDGFAVLSEIQTDETLSKVPVIVASNLGQEDDIEKAKKLGAKEFIVKSNFKMSDLVDMVNTITKA